MKITRLILSLALVLTLVLGNATGLAQGPANLADGVYNGSGVGMNSNIEVSVTVKDGVIADVEVLNHKEESTVRMGLILCWMDKTPLLHCNTIQMQKDG